MNAPDHRQQHTPISVKRTAAQVEAFFQNPSTLEEFWLRFQSQLKTNSSVELWTEVLEHIQKAGQNTLFCGKWSFKNHDTGDFDPAPESQWVAAFDYLKRHLNATPHEQHVRVHFMNAVLDVAGRSSWGKKTSTLCNYCEEVYIHHEKDLNRDVFLATYARLIKEKQSFEPPYTAPTPGMDKAFANAMRRGDAVLVRQMAPAMNLRGAGSKNAFAAVLHIDVLKEIEPYVDFRWDKSFFLSAAVDAGKLESVLYLIPKSQPTKGNSWAMHRAIYSWVQARTKGDTEKQKNAWEMMDALEPVSNPGAAFFGYRYAWTSAAHKAIDELMSLRAPKKLLVFHRKMLQDDLMIQSVAEADRCLLNQAIGEQNKKNKRTVKKM